MKIVLVAQENPIHLLRSPSLLMHHTNEIASSIPQTMRAWQFEGTSPTLEANLKLNRSAPLPRGADALKTDQVLVKVLVASLNAIDFKAAELPVVGRLITGSPATPGMDFAGRVVALGPNSKKAQHTNLEVGQMVYGRLDDPTKFGTAAEYTIVPRVGCVPIPSGVSVNDAAAATSTGLTAYQAIVPKIKGNSGERVFINGGSGGVGTFAIQIAKAMRCYVVTTCSTPNVELCRSLGADKVIDYKQKDVISEIKKMEKFDLVVDNVGFPADLYWHTPSFTKHGAPYVQVGAPAINVGFLLGNLYKQIWPGWLGGGKRPWEFMGVTNKSEDFAQLSKWMQDGKVRSIVDVVFDMEDKGPVRGYERVRSGRARGKVLVKIAEE